MNNNRNQQRKAKSKRDTFRGKSKYSKNSKSDQKDQEFEYHGTNDPSWYVVNEAMLNDVASLSFNSATGRNYTRYSYQTGSDVVAVPYTDSMPGIMNINVVPVPGVSRDMSSPINVASWSIYSQMRKNNSGGKNYDHPDLMMYFLALDSAYSYYAFLTRVYGLANLYAQQNAYFGKGMLTACGVDANNVVINLANFRSYINNYAIKLSAFATPASITYYSRHTWMFGNAFKDEDDIKAQIYMYQPACFFKYDETTTPGSSRLVPENYMAFTSADGYAGLPSYTVNQLESYGNKLLAPILGSEDFNIMSGDILKAFGDKLWKAELVPSDYLVVPKYDMEALDQIHNTTFVGPKPVKEDAPTTGTRSALLITVDNSIDGRGILFDPHFAGSPVSSYDPIIDFPFGTVEPKRVIIATRGMTVTSSKHITSGESGAIVSSILTCGSDLALYPTVIKTDSLGNMLDNNILFSVNDWEYISGMTANVTLVSPFNQHPIFSVYDANSRSIVFTVGEISNYIVLAESTLERMHANTLMSLFGLPYVT